MNQKYSKGIQITRRLHWNLKSVLDLINLFNIDLYYALKDKQTDFRVKEFCFSCSFASSLLSVAYRRQLCSYSWLPRKLLHSVDMIIAPEIGNQIISSGEDGDWRGRNVLV